MQLAQGFDKPSLRRSEALDRRRHRRVPWVVRVRGLTSEGEEFACTTVDVAAGGLRINLARPALQKGETVILYIDDIGRVEGVVARVLDEIGYAIEFRVPQRKREKIADQLTWLLNKERLGLEEDRVAERRPASGQVIAIYNGVSIACAVADVSLFGVALKTAGPRPMIGDRVKIGERGGTCVRYIEGGFAVDFRTTGSTNP